MRGRRTVYNEITNPEKWEHVNVKNKNLMDDFLQYLKSVGRAESTLRNYRADLRIFFCWCDEFLSNKYFVDLTKRDIAKFQSHALEVWGWSPCRIRTVKATVSSLSNFIENILDDEIQGYKSVVRKIESPPKEAVRDKTIWEESEIEGLLNALVDEGDYEKACFVALAAYGGRRKSELCRFRVSDFAPDKLICDGALYRSDPIRTKGRGRNGKYLNCYTLAGKFDPFLNLWMQYREENGIESEWLFPKHGDLSEQITLNVIDGWVQHFTELTGKPFYYHSLRHFYTTMLSRHGIPDNVIKEIQGWASLDLVAVYCDTSTDDMISQYFGKGGIKTDVTGSISDIK